MGLWQTAMNRRLYSVSFPFLNMFLSFPPQRWLLVFLGDSRFFSEAHYCLLPILQLSFSSKSIVPRKSPPHGFAAASNYSLHKRRGCWCGSYYRAHRRQNGNEDYLGLNIRVCIPRYSPLQSSAAPTGLTTLKQCNWCQRLTVQSSLCCYVVVRD